MTEDNDSDSDEKLGQDETDAESNEDDAQEDDDEAPVSSEDEAGP